MQNIHRSVMDVKGWHRTSAARYLLRTLLWLFTLLTPGVSPVSFAQNRPMPLEYQVKAVYVYNFLKFVDWPPETFDGESDPIHVCVMGEHPLRTALKPIEEQTARRRTIRLHDLAPQAGFTHCQVLFVGIEDSHLTPLLLRSAAGKPILTVSDVPNFMELGGMIGFVIENGRVALEINLRQIRASNLEISAKVLEIASTVVMD